MLVVRGGVALLVCVAASCGQPARSPAPASNPGGAATVAPPKVAPRVGPPRVDFEAGKNAKPDDGLLRLVNEYRRAAGVPPVRGDPKLAKGCREHSKYMVLNRGKPQMYSINAHHQDPKLPGATPDGAECAKRAVLYPNVPNLRAAVHGWMASLYHRQPIISPQIRVVGIGSYPLPVPGRVAVALRFVYEAADPSKFPIIYPADGQLDVPVDFKSEAPNPIPPGGSATPGYPVTLQFPPYEKLTNVRASLTDAAGRSVPVYLSWPGKPASKYNNQPGIVGMIPQQTLRAGTSYAASFTVTWRGKTGTWTTKFSTMKRTEVAATDERALIAAIGRPVRVRGTIKRASYFGSGIAGMVIIKLNHTPGGHLLNISVTVPRRRLVKAFKLPPRPRYLHMLRGRTIEVDAVPAMMFRTLRLKLRPTGVFRVVR